MIIFWFKSLNVAIAMKNPRTYDDTYQTFGDSSENSRHSKYLQIPILLQTTHHCRLIDDKSPSSAFHTVTAVKSDKTRQKDRQMTTCRQSCRRNIFIKQNAV